MSRPASPAPQHQAHPMSSGNDGTSSSAFIPFSHARRRTLERRMRVSLDLNVRLVVFERDLQNLVSQVRVGVRFVQQPSIPAGAMGKIRQHGSIRSNKSSCSFAGTAASSGRLGCHEATRDPDAGLALRLCKKCSASSGEPCQGRSGGMSHQRRKGRAKGAAALAPASAHRARPLAPPNYLAASGIPIALPITSPETTSSTRRFC